MYNTMEREVKLNLKKYIENFHKKNPKQRKIDEIIKKCDLKLFGKSKLNNLSNKYYELSDIQKTMIKYLSNDLIFEYFSINLNRIYICTTFTAPLVNSKLFFGINLYDNVQSLSLYEEEYKSLDKTVKKIINIENLLSDNTYNNINSLVDSENILIGYDTKIKFTCNFLEERINAEFKELFCI